MDNATESSFAEMVLGAATIVMGLIAGLYYAFACAVMVGLARVDDQTFVEVMQRINSAIVNPVFLSSFFGALALPVAAAVLHGRLEQWETTRWIGAAVVLYGITLAVTMGANLPLNDALAHAGDSEGITDFAAARQRFEAAWGMWNTVRAILSTAALGCLARALALQGRVGVG